MLVTLPNGEIMRRLSIFAAVLAMLALGTAQAAVPPGQPEQGPGGKDYMEAEVVKRVIGTAEQPVYIFHGKSTPKQARPVVVFFHSWGGNDPQHFGGWIEHLVRKGNVVIFPRFQEVNRTRPVDAPAIAARMVREALAALANDREARPDIAQVSYVGYLAGSIIALDVAAEGGTDLPQPKLILCLMPGGIAKDAEDRGIKLADLSKLKPSTMLLVMNGDQEHAPADRTGRLIFTEASAIPNSNKLFMRVASDRHGYPTLSASLVSPGSSKAEYATDKIPLPPSAMPQDASKPAGKRNPARNSAAHKALGDAALTGSQHTLSAMLSGNLTDSVDYRGFWKTLDLAIETAAAGRDALALKGNPALADMGSWSDGWPVRRISAETPKDVVPEPVVAEPEPAPVKTKPGRRRR